MPRARLALQGPRRHALVPALRHRHLRARDRHRGLPGAHAPLASSSRSRCSIEPDAVAAGLDDDALDAGRQRRRRGPPGADLRPGRAGRRASTTSPRTRAQTALRGEHEIARRGHGRRAGRPAVPRPVRRAAGRSRTSRTASSPGTRSATPRAPASSTSRPAAARRTSRSRRSTTSPSSRRSTSSASTSTASAGSPAQYVHEVAAADRREPASEKGLLYRAEQYTHRYPLCWRCSTELVFRLVDEWFIAMDELRQPMMDVTRQIDWIPSFGLERELDWLRNMDDWMISKKRYWGLALPIYECAGLRQLRGDRQRERAEGARGRGLGASSRATRRTGPGSTRSRSPARSAARPVVAHPGRRQPLARRRHRRRSRR